MAHRLVAARRLVFPLLAGVLAAAAAAAPALAQDDEDSSQIRFGARGAIPRATCGPGDRPEPGMQGRVPPGDAFAVRAQQGYSCNLAVVGHLPATGFAGLDGLGDCAYYSLSPAVGGVLVVDVSDPANPVPTATLQTPAMQDTGESMKVNAKRKLLVAGSYATNGYLDIYDISECRHPRLLSSTDMSPGLGHEGWFAPDGMTYYMSASRANAESVFPIDISDPAHPKRLASWMIRPGTASHGGFTTEDGKRTYICQQAPPPLDSLRIVDTSEVAARTPDPQARVLHEEQLGENQWCQGAYRVTYRGHPYLIQFGERAGAPDCSRSADNWATFAYPRIYDLANEDKPRLVSTALLESALPENCPAVQGDLLAVNGFGYSVHHCSPDRLYNPTILACSWFSAGLRILDIRDPHNPRELAYFNPGSTAPLATASRVVVRSDRREVWFGNVEQGFYVARFADGVWPFAGAAPCPEYDDYWFATYNEASKCATANFSGLGKPAPGGVRPAPPPAPSAGKLQPTLSLRVVRSGRRFRVSGRLDPRGAANACRGRITLTVKRARRTVLVRRLALSSRCRFTATISRRGRLTFVARFPGNRQLQPASTRS